MTRGAMRGVIPKAAIKKFLARKRRDYRRWQDKTLRELQDYCDALAERPPIWKVLQKHQRVCFILGARLRRFCFWNDTGTGKTLLSLALMLYFRKIGLVRRNLVLVPNKVNKYEWVRDVHKWSPNTECLVLRGSSDSKWIAMQQSKAGIIIETYGGLIHLLTETMKITHKGKKPRIGQVIDMKKVDRLRSIVQGLYMDESIYVVRKKGFGSLMHRLCKHLANTCETVFALNGTPFGRDPTDLWGQMHIVDQGYSLGETLGLFRAAFFTAKENFFGGPTYTFIKKLEPLLHDFIANASIRYTADAADLPKVVPITREVLLADDAQSYYDKARDAVLAARGNYREMKNAFMRMRQVSSGFVGYYDDELGTKASYVFKPNPKLESLLSYIDSIDPRYKIVVFHQFTFSGNLIEAALRKEGYDTARIYGKTKDPDAELEAFSKDPRCGILLLQNDAGGYGLDRVKVARYGLYYESPVGTVLRKQTMRRVERQYSEHSTVFIVDFVTRGTVDQQILDAHAEGFDLFAAIVEGRKKVR